MNESVHTRLVRNMHIRFVTLSSAWPAAILRTRQFLAAVAREARRLREENAVQLLRWTIKSIAVQVGNETNAAVWRR